MPGRVESYRSLGSGRYKRVLKHLNVYGDGGVLTTLEDLAQWAANFYTGRVGGPGFAQAMETTHKQDSGDGTRYAAGLEVYTRDRQRVV